MNKKVLLRERKRHTARRVVSTPSVLAGGVMDPGPPPPGGYPDPGPPPPGVPGPPRGYPDPGPPQGGPGTPRGLGTPPGGPGTPPAAPWHSGKCCKALWDMGTPPLWTDRWMDGRTDACQNITFPRTPYAGGKNLYSHRKLSFKFTPFLETFLLHFIAQLCNQIVAPLMRIKNRIL